MPVLTPIPEKTINFKVYVGGVVDMIGIASVELPEIKPMSESISGSGVMGEIDAPTPGHYGSMELKLKFRSLTGDIMFLMDPTDKDLRLVASVQVHDYILGRSREEGHDINVGCRFKGANMGGLEVSKAGNPELTFEVYRIKYAIDRIPQFDIDKLAFKNTIGGVDYALTTRKNLLLGV
jgi:phage tail tube protein FII